MDVDFEWPVCGVLITGIDLAILQGWSQPLVGEDVIDAALFVSLLCMTNELACSASAYVVVHADVCPAFLLRRVLQGVKDIDGPVDVTRNHLRTIRQERKLQLDNREQIVSSCGSW